MMLQIKLIAIGLVVLEIFRIEIVNGRTHGRTDAGSTTIL